MVGDVINRDKFVFYRPELWLSQKKRRHYSILFVEKLIYKDLFPNFTFNFRACNKRRTSDKVRRENSNVRCKVCLHELLFRHIFETQIHIQTQDLENLHISLGNQWFSLNVIKISQRVVNDQIIHEKTSLQKSVILPILRGVSPT